MINDYAVRKFNESKLSDEGRGLHIAPAVWQAINHHCRWFGWSRSGDQSPMLSIINKTIHLSNDSGNSILLGHLSSIPIISSILYHVLNPCFSTGQVSLQLNNILILLDALSF
jgi:hypothetical protein